jgi:3-dehydroquinate dehydratase-1
VDVVEARLDLFPEQNLGGAEDACLRLEASGTPVLVTLRTAQQGGRYAGQDRERLPLFRAALVAASWVDVEDDAEIIDELRSTIDSRPGGQLIISHHDFAGTPPLSDLVALVDRGRANPRAIVKIATTVHGDADRRTLLDLLAARPERLCVIGMGASNDLRIELAARGALLAYGYLDQPTAPGQLSAEDTHARLLAACPRYAARKPVRQRR